MAYECIDKHVDEGKADKIALNYKDDKRKESYTFKEMQANSNKAANVLKDKAHVEKGDRVFIFMPRTPELYFALFGILKMEQSLDHCLKHLWKKQCLIDLKTVKQK